MKKTNQTKAKKKSNAKQGACHKAEPPFCLDASNYRSGFASVVKLLEGRKNVLVLAGAGISVSCGIPDFRSRGCGLYATLDADEYGLSCPEDLFEWEVFRDDPRPFYRFAKALYFPKGRDKPLEPSDSHRFLALLQKKGMLLRVYTQNIDGLEQAAGVSPKKMVYAHGSLQWATCCKCKHRVSSADIEDSILAGTVPRCTQNASPPEEKPVSKRSSSRKRARPVRSPARKGCGGVLKPGVTFFGETLHGNVSRSLEIDREKADALVVIGTSLSVAPMSHVIDYLPPDIPRILINRTVVHPPISRSLEDDDDDDDANEDQDFRVDYVFDAYVLGFCDDVTRAFVKKMAASNSNEDKEEGKLLSRLKADDELYRVDDWGSLNLPANRVFLFPGASCGDDHSLYSYREIAHCDGCAEEIHGTIRKCVQCFDYDLCEECFPKQSKSHYKGQHKFSSEPAGYGYSRATP